MRLQHLLVPLRRDHKPMFPHRQVQLARRPQQIAGFRPRQLTIHRHHRGHLLRGPTRRLPLHARPHHPQKTGRHLDQRSKRQRPRSTHRHRSLRSRPIRDRRQPLAIQTFTSRPQTSRRLTKRAFSCRCLLPHRGLDSAHLHPLRRRLRHRRRTTPRQPPERNPAPQGDHHPTTVQETTPRHQQTRRADPVRGR